MRTEFHKVYEDKRGWRFMARRRSSEWGVMEDYYTICFHKKGDPPEKWKKVNGTSYWPTSKQAEKELREYAESHDMKAVL